MMVRTGVGVLAAALGLHALWLSVAEIARADLPYFPQTATAAKAAADLQSSAKAAAWIGLFRGDLWTEAAITQTARFGFAGADAPALPPATDDDTKTLAGALAWAPYDPRAWLLLAAVTARPDANDERSAGWLKSSYYTGPNVPDLMPMRLGLVTRSKALGDSELQDLARAEIRAILGRLPQLRPAIIEAYRAAVPNGRKFIEATVKDTDPAFSNEIAAERRRR